jgi:hypothetical protein
MTAHEGPRQELWIEVPATSSVEELARVVDEFPPGTAGRYYLVHMDLMAGRIDFGDALARRGYQVTTSDLLRRYAFGTQKEHFAVFWLGDDRTLGETSNPAPPCISLPPREGLPRIASRRSMRLRRCRGRSITRGSTRASPRNGPYPAPGMVPGPPDTWTHPRLSEREV